MFDFPSFAPSGIQMSWSSLIALEALNMTSVLLTNLPNLTGLGSSKSEDLLFYLLSIVNNNL